jgi:DNA-binding NarL/FixJ family response regulator
MKQAKVFIIEDNLIYRMGLKELLSLDDRFLCVGEADNGLNALTSLSKVEADIILLDLEMPRSDGVQFLRELWGLRLDVKVLVLSQESPRHRIQELLDLGIHGHIMKVEDSSEILRGLHALADGQKYFSAKMGERYYEILREYRLRPAATQPLENAVAKLSPREKQIALLIGEGKTNKDMARILECSEHTIKCHKANLMRKMGVQNSAEVVMWTSRAGLF